MPPKRRTAAPPVRAHKRRKVDSESDDEVEHRLRGIGAPSQDDNQLAVAPSTSSQATRTPLSAGNCQTLSSLAIRVFASTLEFLFKPGNEPKTKAFLSKLPDHLVPRLFAQLRALHASKLTHAIIVTHFLRGDEIVLTGELAQVKSNTISAISRLGSVNILRSLELSGLVEEALPDEAAAKLIAQLPSLEKLVLRESKGVASLAITAAADHCPNLRHVNISYTNPSTKAVSRLVESCLNIETLKVAGIPHLSKTGLKPVLLSIKETTLNGTDDGIGRHITNLKLRSLHIATDSSYRALLSSFPNLRRLDLSHTNLHFTDALFGDTVPPLEKLSINHTPTTGVELCQALPRFGSIRILNVGALGLGKSVAGMQTKTMFALTPQVLRDVTDILVNFDALEHVSLAASPRVAARDAGEMSALQDFIARVGRRSKFLDLSNIPDLKPHDLATLVADDDTPPAALEHLLLSGCPKIDDDAAAFIAACANLRVLHLNSTSIRTDGVFQIIDRCEKIDNIDLTACRGIRLQDRRRIFEAWQEAR